MPSTHVVYEGINQVKKDILEDELLLQYYLRNIKRL